MDSSNVCGVALSERAHVAQKYFPPARTRPRSDCAGPCHPAVRLVTHAALAPVCACVLTITLSPPRGTHGPTPDSKPGFTKTLADDCADSVLANAKRLKPTNCLGDHGISEILTHVRGS